MSTTQRTLQGHSVTFRKREPSPFWVADFYVLGERFQRTTKRTVLAEAERVVTTMIKGLLDAKQGLAEAGRADQSVKGRAATVGAVLEMAKGGEKLMDAGTLRTYGSALLRWARVVDDADPMDVPLERVLREETWHEMVRRVQGLKVPNLVDPLPCNGGLNTTLRNVRALFSPRVVRTKLGRLLLPDLRVLRGIPFLKHEEHGFVPWAREVYEAMDAAAAGLRESNPELWLVNAMLRRLGLRDGELLAARGDWLERRLVGGVERLVLVIQTRPDFKLPKGGRPRTLVLDEELAGLLAGREGYLILPDGSPTARLDLIYRTHSKWMRQFVPAEVDGKTNHQLRMYAGSLVLRKTGSMTATAAFLGHKSVTTTERYYARHLEASEALTAADLVV